MGNDKEDLLSALTVEDPDAKESIVYEGMENVLSGWDAYWQDVAIDFDQMEDLEDCMYDNNSFMILFDAVHEEIKAVRSFGMHSLQGGDFLFRTDYLPISVFEPESQEDLLNRIQEVQERLDNEIAQMREKFEKPVFLVQLNDIDKYVGWSLNENRYVIVSNYRQSNDDFLLMKINADDKYEILEKSAYGIIPPSQELIEAMNLFLNPELFEFEEKQERKELKEKKTTISPEYQALYDRAINLINKGRQGQYECESEAEAMAAFMYLESRVDRFERENDLQVSGCILESEVKLIKESIKVIETLFVRN